MAHFQAMTEHEDQLAKVSFFDGLEPRGAGPHCRSNGGGSPRYRHAQFFNTATPATSSSSFSKEGCASLARSLAWAKRLSRCWVPEKCSAKWPSWTSPRVRQTPARTSVARLLVIPKDSFDDLLFLHKDLAYEVLWSCVRMLSTRLRETNDKLTFLSTSGKF